MANAPARATKKKRARGRFLRARGRSLQITKAGWLFIGLTLLVGFAAINSGSNLLHAVFGAQMALIVGSGVLSEASVRRVSARRQVAGPLHMGQPAALVVEVFGTDRRDVLAVSVEDDERGDPDVDGRCEPVFAVRVPGRSSLRVPTTVVMPRRGPARLPRAVVATRFPFGLFIKRRELPTPGEVLVYPALARPEGARAPDDPAGERAQGARRRSRAGEFFGLREYRDGDDPRGLHWPAIARLGRPVVRELESGARPERIVDLPHGDAGEAGFELAIQRVAGAVVDALDHGERVALAEAGRIVLPPGEGPGQRRLALQHLARLGFADHDDDTSASPREGSREGSREGP